MVIRDRDSKFGPSFERALGLYGAKSYRVEHRAPNMNAYAERLVQTLKVECLDHFVAFGLRHFDHILAEYLEY